MSARLPRASMGHAVLLTSPGNGNRPLWSYLHTGTLPRLISFVCHSYENTGGVGVFFPFWFTFLTATEGSFNSFPGPASEIPRRSDVATCRRFDVPLSPLSATLARAPISVYSKARTEILNPLAAALAKNRGRPTPRLLWELRDAVVLSLEWGTACARSWFRVR